MRWPRVRLTVRRLMLVVFGFAIALHLGVAAWRADRSRGRHIHSAVIDGDPIPGWLSATPRDPFWPAFWRRSTGLSWWDRRACGMAVGPAFNTGDPILLETCELAHPEIRKPLGPNSDSEVHTREQIDLYMKLMRAKGRVVSYEDGQIRMHMPNR